MRFCFYSEYYDLKGGYTTLIMTLIKELHRIGHEVILINYKNGLIAKELKKSGIEITIIERAELNRKNAGNFIRSSDVLVIPRFYESLKALFDINPKVIYYDINDYICRISDYRFGIKLPFLGKKLIRKLIDARGLAFMDDTGPLNLEREFGIKISTPEYLPVPIEDERSNVFLNSAKELNEGVIRITYIGRAVDWKMYPLRKIIEDCALTNEAVEFHIAVDNVASFRNYIHIESYQDTQLTFKVSENLLPSEIRPFLIEHADLHFGMGTTALHAASIGIPTILMDFSSNPFPEDYTYRWFSESRNFSLGKNIATASIPKGIAFKDILHLLRNKQERERISDDAFRYVAKYHAASSVVQKLISLGTQCGFRLKLAGNLNPYYFKTHSLIKTIFSPFQKQV